MIDHGINVSGRSGVGPKAGVVQKLSIIMRIIKELGEMQQKQIRLETSSMQSSRREVPACRISGSAESASESLPAPVDLKRYLPGG